MTGELADLYQEVILDHTRSPRNEGRLETATCTSEGYNPLCGDKVRIYVRVEDDRVEEISFEGTGCAISTASASLLTEALRGRSLTEVQELFTDFRALVTDEAAEPDLDRLGKLVALGGVRKFPMRIKCATLVWHTLRAALEGADEAVSTEV